MQIHDTASEDYIYHVKKSSIMHRTLFLDIANIAWYEFKRASLHNALKLSQALENSTSVASI